MSGGLFQYGAKSLFMICVGTITFEGGFKSPFMHCGLPLMYVLVPRVENF